MEKNKQWRFLVALPIMYLLMWLRVASEFVEIDAIFIIPALLFLIGILCVGFLFFKINKFLTSSKIGFEYLNSILRDKLVCSAGVFTLFILIGESASLIAYPVVMLVGVVISLSVFSIRRHSDILAVKDMFEDTEWDSIKETCYKILCGRGMKYKHHQFNKTFGFENFRGRAYQANSVFDIYGAQEIEENNNTSCLSETNLKMDSYLLAPCESVAVNPSTGLYMVGGGVDSEGNPFGVAEIIH
ncbi:Uncharacterised protein [Serratia quinivorans]|uniref:hypothetical protein n=1 Tax=Serratia TaxID=613 RepID=UPI001F4BFC26|nr:MULTISPECIES: hypothetical protein [Serratia]ULG14994.1 hypothetical protein 149p2_00018 [Serratia proteamaculans]CAI2160900.1 Uncharacterised protein [Serratia quinivorans]CAI2161087.1 Uncharacterised protein [Serratia quinivorans]